MRGSPGAGGGGRARDGGVHAGLPARRPRGRRRGARAGGRPTSGRCRDLAAAHGPAGPGPARAAGRAARPVPRGVAGRHPHLVRATAGRRVVRRRARLGAGPRRAPRDAVLPAALRGTPARSPARARCAGDRRPPGHRRHRGRDGGWRSRHLRPGGGWRRQPVAGPAQHERRQPRPRVRLRRALDDRRRPRRAVRGRAVPVPSRNPELPRRAADRARPGVGLLVRARLHDGRRGGTRAARLARRRPPTGRRARPPAGPCRPPAPRVVPRCRRADAVPGLLAHETEPQLPSSSAMPRTR